MEDIIAKQKRSWKFIVKIIAIAILSGVCFLICVYLISVFAVGISLLQEKGQGAWVPAAIALLLIGALGLFYLRKRILKKENKDGLSGEGD